MNFSRHHTQGSIPRRLSGLLFVYAVAFVLALSILPGAQAQAGTIPSPGFGSNEHYDGEYIGSTWDGEALVPLVHSVSLMNTVTVVQLPFLFPYHGVYHDRLYVSQNGLISFEGLDGSTGSWVELVGKRAIAAGWQATGLPLDLVTVLWTPEPDRVIFQWEMVGGFRTAAILESTGTITIQFHPGTSLAGATVGISDGNGADFLIAYDGGPSSNADGVRFNPIGVRPVVQLDEETSTTPACNGADTFCATVGVEAATADYRVLGDFVVEGQEATASETHEGELGLDPFEEMTGLHPIRIGPEGVTIHPSPHGMAAGSLYVEESNNFQNASAQHDGVSFTCEGGARSGGLTAQGEGYAPFNLNTSGVEEPSSLAEERCRITDHFGIFSPVTIPFP